MADKEGARERIAWSLSDGIDASLRRGASLDDVELVRKFRSSCAGMDAQRIGCVLFHKSTVLAVTQAWSQCWRFSEDEVRGRTLALLQGPKSKTAELISFQKQLRLRSGPCAASLINYTKNGRPMPCFVHAFPIGKDHYVSFMICGISQDRALSSSLGNTELKSSNDPDAVENNEDYTFADVQDFVANLSAVQNNTHTPKNKLYVSDQCNLMFALYEIFWHILFYFTGPLSLLVIVPVCGSGFAKLHGFIWMGGNGAFSIIMMAMEYAIFALVSWSTVRFALMNTEAEAISGADLGTTNMTSMNASLSPSPSPIASSWANSAQMSAQWRCADLELDVGTPLFFVLVRLVVIVTKYARMTRHGRDKLMHHTQTFDKRVDFVRRTLLAAWAGIAFDAWPSKLAVESEFDRIPSLREHKVMLASTPAATQALGLQTQTEIWVGQPDSSVVNQDNPLRAHGEARKEKKLQLQLSDLSNASFHRNSRRKASPVKGDVERVSSMVNFSEPKKNICGPKCSNSMENTTQYHSVSIVDIVTAICLETGEKSKVRKLWGIIFVLTAPAYILMSLYARYTSGRLPRQMDQCKDTLAYDEMFLALSLIVGGLLLMSMSTFFAVMHIDLARRHAQMSKIGQVIHYLVLEGPSNALAWLQARRVLVQVGNVYVERLAYFMGACGVLFIFMFLWSIEQSARAANVPLPRSYPLFLVFSTFFQLSVLVSLREAGLANGSAKKHAQEWCSIRTQLLEELGSLQLCLESKLRGERRRGQGHNREPRVGGNIRKRPRRLSLNFQAQTRSKGDGSSNILLRNRNSLEYMNCVDSAQIRSDIGSLKCVELAVSSCIDEMKILNISYPLRMHRVPLSLALFRALVGLFYTQIYVLLVYSLRILNSSSDVG